MASGFFAFAVRALATDSTLLFRVQKMKDEAEGHAREVGHILDILADIQHGAFKQIGSQ